MGEVIGAVCILESGRCIAKLYQSGTHAHINWDEEVKSGMDGLSCFGFMNDGSTGRPNAAPFAIVEGLDGDYALRINETTRYGSGIWTHDRREHPASGHFPERGR